MTTILILIPLLGALLSFFGSRHVCFMVALFELVCAIFIAFTLDPGQQLREDLFQGFTLIIDGLSMPFVLLTALLTPICIAIHGSKKGCFNFLLLEALLVAFFTTSDLLYFFVFFEASLIPMFFIIGIWGGQRKVYAAFKIVLYTLVGSISFLISLGYIVAHCHSTEIANLADLISENLSAQAQHWLWWGIFIALAVKIPMLPLHTWLPDAHVQAPTGGSVMLAGVLIKMGGYGLVRVLLPLLPEASRNFADIVIWVSIAAVVYASFICLIQKDMKKLVAYSSIAHMGFVTAALFSFSAEGLSGAVFQMVSHGLISSGLFLCVGFLYDRTHVREISFYSGVVNSMPKFAILFIMLAMASMGLPSTSGFVGEFLSIVGVFQHSKLMGALLASGVVLGSLYMLWLCKRVIWGQLNEATGELEDLHPGETLSLAVLVLAIITLGVYPNLLLNLIEKPVLSLLSP